MALTRTVVEEGIAGNLRWKLFTITFDSSYATGGESLTADDCGMGRLHSVPPVNADGYTFEYDYTNAKIIAYNSVTAHQHNFKIWNRGSTVAGTATLQVSSTAPAAGKLQHNSASVTLTTLTPVQAATVSAGSEVANATDLSAVSFRLMVWGQ